MFQQVLAAYGFNDPTATLVPIGNGLIHRTWKLVSSGEEYILQQINTKVFKDPEAITCNISALDAYLKKHVPQYLFVSPVPTKDGAFICYIEGEGYYRIFPFIKKSHAIDVVQNPSQAFEAARQFGLFTSQLAGFDADSLKITLPQFHDLSFRYQQFAQAIKNGNHHRKELAADCIQFLQQHKNIVDEFEHIKKNPAFKIRVTHHDTKISNVLFDENDKGICVIDLDTVMPGYFISDTGDMMRTYLSPVNEEETDFSKIEIREDFFIAIVDGYLQSMKDQLTSAEKKAFVFSGKFMIYMQALRFLTDYLEDDIYYGAKYDQQNFNRAQNQVVLLQMLLEKEPYFSPLLF
jgi:Ser/Thr protein kinase RdoA (MazF antagonist)